MHYGGVELSLKSLSVLNKICKQGRLAEAINRAKFINQHKLVVNPQILQGLLKECRKRKDIKAGVEICSVIFGNSLELNRMICKEIMQIYSLAGKLTDALEVFRNLPKKDCHMWTLIISLHVKNKQELKAIELYHEMWRTNVKPNVYTYAAALNACASVSDLKLGRFIHAQILSSEVAPDDFLLNSVLHMYVKCGSIADARQVFVKLPKRDLFCWNTMISGCVQNGSDQEALQLFEKMQEEQSTPDRLTFLFLLKACIALKALDQGRHIHAQVVKYGFISDIVIGNTLVDMYSRCGSISEATQVLHNLPKRDVVSWNALIAGCVRHGHAQEAFQFYEQMREEGVEPDRITFLALLKASASLGSIHQGKKIHSMIVESGLPLDVSMESTLVDMYAKCGCLEAAWQVFSGLPQPNVVSWTAIIGAFAQHGHGNHALRLFLKMQQEGVQPDRVTYLSALKACSSIRALNEGKLIHSQLVCSGLGSDLGIGNTLIDMYAACGSIDEARKMFLSMSEQDVVSWNAMIDGCAKMGFCEEALYLFRRMQLEGVKPNRVTYVGVLQACGNIIALDQGRLIHSQILDSGLESDLFICNNLIDMYAKCGSIEDAHELFSNLLDRDVVSWNTMIDARAQLGHGLDALDLFHRMQEANIQPDKLTFVSILSACSRSGLLNEGSQIFHSMCSKFGLTPDMQHYACMVDILGRAGKLDEAHEFISKMPIQPNVHVWMSLLGACRLHGNVDLGRASYEAVLKLELANVAANVLMCNIYAASGRRVEETQIKEEMRSASRKWNGCN